MLVTARILLFYEETYYKTMAKNDACLFREFDSGGAWVTHEKGADLRMGGLK
jgi:hypothetical protein